MEYLISVDLEGIHNAVGVKYELFSDAPDFALSKQNAVKEVNAAIKALFDSGASKVAVWDNHAGGGNLDFSKIDPRATEIVGARENRRRMDFAEAHNFAAILYIGYHSREGTIGGVLAHTFNGLEIQYVKINGQAVGEMDIDSYIAADHGMAPIFASSDDKGIMQVKQISPNIVTVITKFGEGRHSAQFRDEQTVLDEIYEGVCRAVKTKAKKIHLKAPAEVEIRYTRAVIAEDMLARAKEAGIPSRYGEDSHTIIYEISKANDIPYLL